jgi:hypothetical protein
MATITLSIPDEIRKKMKQFDQVNWSFIARKAVISEINEIERKEALRAMLHKESKELKWTIDLGSQMKKDRIAQLRKKGLLE